MNADSAYERQRAHMVVSQIEARGVRNERVLAAMGRVARHLFVPDEMREHAYEDRPLPIGWGQTISQPYMVSAMTEALHLEPTDRVLEIGTGSGYQAAILSLLAKEVISIERIAGLAESASNRLMELGYLNVTVRVGDGTMGCPHLGPYDAIIVTAAGPDVPPALKEQLAERGRLVCPVGSRDTQRLAIIRRTAAGFQEEPGMGCMFVPLIGADGWPN